VELLKQHKAKHGKVPDDGSRELDLVTREAAGKTILLGWKNLKVAGRAVKYSAKKSAEIMRDYDLLFLYVKDLSERVGEFRPDKVAKK
jgi:hypothetical protein